ncbi:MAG: PadR family transcriptional regulator [Candidatus Acidiferrales bacterium]
MKDDLHDFLPLSPATLHILLALAGDDRHGYAIMQAVARQSGGQYKIGPGTLYENLDKLVAKDLVKKLLPRASGEDPRRRYYRLTDLGRYVLSADLARLKAVLKEAKLHLPAAETSNS